MALAFCRVRSRTPSARWHCLPDCGLRSVTDAFRQHVIEFGDRKLRVPDQRVGDGMALGLLDVLRPARGVVGRVGAEPDGLAIAPLELGHQPRHVAELACRCSMPSPALYRPVSSGPLTCSSTTSIGRRPEATRLLISEILAGTTLSAPL